MIAERPHFQTALETLVRFIEVEAPGMLGAVFFGDPDAVHTTAPSLPTEFVDALRGSPVATCAATGTVPGRDQRIAAHDILRDSRWGACRNAAKPLGFRVCWPSPILSERGAPLGCFAAFSREARDPTEREIRLIGLATSVAALVIDRGKSDANGHGPIRPVGYAGRVVTQKEFSRSFAHELYQPLTAVLCQAQLAQNLLRIGAPDVAAVEECLREIVLGGRQASAVIERLRAQLRSEPVRPPIDLNHLVRAAVDLAWADLSTRGVLLRLRLRVGLPSIAGDVAQLKLVILNLIVNACDAMGSVAPADRRLTVESRLSAGGEAVELEIGGGRMGIPEENLERIFGPSYANATHGLGLGLAVGRSVVRAHMGDVWAAKNSDGGATFHLVLPVVGKDGEAGEERP